MEKISTSIYPSQAKAILFFLTNQEELAPKILPHFEPMLGPVEFQGAWHPFDQSDYYEKELGKNLRRCLVGFKNIFEPHYLPELKQLAKDCEQRTTCDGRRLINIDPGYVDLFKVVLASGKAGGQKVALSKDIYAYTLLRYEKGKWIPFEWTYPDFKSEIYHKELLRIRESLRVSLRGA